MHTEPCLHITSWRPTNDVKKPKLGILFSISDSVDPIAKGYWACESRYIGFVGYSLEKIIISNLLVFQSADIQVGRIEWSKCTSVNCAFILRYIKFKSIIMWNALVIKNGILYAFLHWTEVIINLDKLRNPISSSSTKPY